MNEGWPTMKRLGMWNRLALVIVTFATFAAPVAIALNIQNDIYESKRVWLDQCYAIWDGRELEDGYSAGRMECLDDYLKPSETSVWSDYWELALATLIVCAVLYALIWIVVATAKWIWRGREAGNRPSPVRATPQDETD